MYALVKAYNQFHTESKFYLEYGKLWFSGDNSVHGKKSWNWQTFRRLLQSHVRIFYYVNFLFVVQNLSANNSQIQSFNQLGLPIIAQVQFDKKYFLQSFIREKLSIVSKNWITCVLLISFYTNLWSLAEH